jgi:hypothetical protein
VSVERHRALSAALVIASTWSASVGASELVAERITEANAVERRIGGPDAMGGVGDWYLANDVVEVIVDDAARRHAKLNHGGTIVDAGLRGRDGDDQFARLFPVVNMDQQVLLNYDTVRAEVDPGGRWARLVVSSSQGMGVVARGGAWARRLDPLVPDEAEIRNVLAETSYTVRPGEPFVRLRTVLRNTGDTPAPILRRSSATATCGCAAAAACAPSSETP